MKYTTIELTSTEISHILNLISANEEEGCYSGWKEQYWNRSERIKKKLLMEMKE